MDVWFLEAAVPVTKRIEQLPDGTIKKHPYPLVSEFTSHRVTINSLQDLAAAVELCGAKGWTMIKGALTRDLNNESRMGTTIPDQATDWICFDLDGLEMPPHHYANDVEAFMEMIGLGDISYVIQWSASAGLPGSRGLRCHIFVRLNVKIGAALLKDYLKHLNLELPFLSAQLSLTASHVALKWPLDITSCQNDKLIYIAPPSLSNLEDPFPSSRVKYVQKGLEILSASRLPISDTGKLRQKLLTKLAELRGAAGLPDMNLKFKKTKKGKVEYAPSPSEARVTGEKRERGFVYLNLNGGDSWGYYYPEDKPEYIFNFKGEPIYRTEELLPSYWAALQEGQTIQTDTSGKLYLAFSDLSRNGRDAGLEYDVATDTLKITEFMSESKARQWSKTHGKVIGDTMPFFETIYNPLSKDVIDLENKTINTYRSSLPSKSEPRVVSQIPPYTAAIINHVFSGEEPLIEHFHNWVACIVQHAAVTGTAWVWHGVQGTGKGLLYNLLAHVLGPTNCVNIRMDALESQFTGAFRNKQLINIDEIQTSASRHEQGTVIPKIKQFITQDTINYRAMYSEGKDAPNYANLILSSNHHDPVVVPRDDRRINVAAYQPRALVPHVMSKAEARMYGTTQPEADDMYWYWKTRDTDLYQASTPFDNAARDALTEVSSTAIELASEALRNGDIKYFWEALPTAVSTGGGITLTPRDIIVQRYKEIIARIVLQQETKVLRDELVIIMQYLVTDRVPVSPLKFTQYMRHQRIEISDVWRDGRKQRGVVIPWVFDPAWLASVQAHAQTLAQ